MPQRSTASSVSSSVKSISPSSANGSVDDENRIKKAAKRFEKLQQQVEAEEERKKRIALRLERIMKEAKANLERKDPPKHKKVTITDKDCADMEDMIMHERIPKKYAIYLDKRCYDARTLWRWVQENGTIPHNRRQLTDAEKARIKHVASASPVSSPSSASSADHPPSHDVTVQPGTLATDIRFFKEEFENPAHSFEDVRLQDKTYIGVPVTNYIKGILREFFIVFGSRDVARREDYIRSHHMSQMFPSNPEYGTVNDMKEVTIEPAIRHMNAYIYNSYHPDMEQLFLDMVIKVELRGTSKWLFLQMSDTSTLIWLESTDEDMLDSINNVDFDGVFLKTERIDMSDIATTPVMGGTKKTHKYNGRTYVLRTGSRGGKYIVVGADKKKVYIR